MIFVSATLYGGINVEESATVMNAYVCGVPKILTKNIQTRSPCRCYAEILLFKFLQKARQLLIIIQWTYFEGNYNDNLQPWQKPNICLVVMRVARELGECRTTH